MKEGWRRIRIGDELEVVTGNTPPKSDQLLYGDYIPLVKPPELQDCELVDAEDGLSQAGTHLARIAPAGSALVSCIGNLGKTGLNSVPVAFNQQINAILPCPEKVVPKFLLYQMLSTAFKGQLEASASGTTIVIVNKSRFKDIRILPPPPPLPDQQRIVALLDEALAGLATAKANANAERNLQNAHAVFEGHLQSVFSEQAEGWVEVELADLCIVDWGNTDLTKRAYVEGGEFLAVSAAGCDGRIDHKEHSKYTPVLSAIGAQCGRMFLPEEDFTAIKNTITLTPKQESCTGKFLYRLLTHVDLPRRGAAQPFISKGDIQQFRVSAPKSLATQQAIEESLSRLSEETQLLTQIYERKLAALEELKKSLLQQAFSGEL